MAPAVREPFDASWLFHEGELSNRPRRLVGKANAASYAADLTQEEFRSGAPLNIIADAPGDNQVSFNRLQKLGPEWEAVDLPHDWRVRHAPSDKGRENLRPGYQLAYQGYWHPGVAYYRKTFDYAPLADDDRLRLTFDGVVGHSEFWFNGFYLGPHLTAYTPVSFDITELLRPESEGPNVVLVRSDTREAEGWWYEGGGISRHVWLERRPAISVLEDEVVVTCSDISQEKATVSFSIAVQNESGNVDPIAISISLIDPRGAEIDRLHQTVPVGHRPATLQTTVQDPLLWNIGDGQLYAAEVSLEQNGRLHHTQTFRFGIRHVEVQKDGIVVNGRSHKMKGCNIHADFAGVGVALPDRLTEAKLELLREMGTNTVRIAHHPPTPELVEHADRMGIFVIPENRLLSTAPQHLGYLRSMVRRFRNSPSILLWSIENEEVSLQGTATGTVILKRLVREVNTLDPTRHTNFGGVINLDHPYHNATSVIGMHYQGLFNTVRQTLNYFPDKPHIQDEVGLHAPTRGVYETRPELGHNSAFSTIAELMPSFPGLVNLPCVGSGDFVAKDNIATLLTEVFTRPNTAGGCIWAGIDYHGEPVPTAWPSVVSPYGARDLVGIPKDYYWLVRCLFREEPLVHAFPHWTWPGKEGRSIPFRVYSNCQEVTVSVNGKVVDRKPVTSSAAYFPDGITYSPGELLVLGLVDGHAVAEHRVRTASQAKRLFLQSDRTQLAPSGTDVALVRVAVVDTQGHLVPQANDKIYFSIEGARAQIIGVGNGDNATTEPEQGNERHAFNGWAAVLIQAGTEAGVVTLTASSPGLESAQQGIEASEDVNPHAVYAGLNELEGPAGIHSTVVF